MKIKQRKPTLRSKIRKEIQEDFTQFTSGKDTPLLKQMRKKKLERKIDFEDVEKPIVEFHSQEGKTILSTADVMFGASHYAGLIVTDLELKNSIDEYLESINFTEQDKGFDSLDRIVIKDNGPDHWTVTIHYLEGQNDHSSMVVLVDKSDRSFNEENARLMAEDYVAYSMYKDGEVNPENSIQQRVFQFDQATLTVSKSLFMHAKEFLGPRAKFRERSEFENVYYQQIADKFGGKFTDMDIPKLEKDYFSVLQITSAFLLVRGYNKWPFEE